MTVKAKIQTHPASQQCIWKIVAGRENRNKFVPNISSRWNALQEAFWFYRSVRAGRMDVDAAIAMIDMSERQLAWLCKTFPPDARVCRGIYRQRKRTLAHFVKAYIGKYPLGAMKEEADREAAETYKLARSNTASGAGTAEPE